MTAFSLPARALIVLSFIFCCASATYAANQESLDIGAMLPQSAPEERDSTPPPATPEPAASEKPKPKKAKAKSLALAGIRDFDRFQDAYARLSISEQLRYVVYPFILYTVVEGSGDGKAQTLRQNYTSEPFLSARAAGWQNLLAPRNDGGYLSTLEMSEDKVTACSRQDGKCRYTYEFVWRDNCWRMRAMRASQPGI